jgi:HK97 family phage prohead protease
MDIKNITLGQIKAGPEAGLKPGQMRAYASVFGNVDSYGDIVAKGAFTNTLAEWRQAKNKTIPLLYGHNMSDPNMNIGAVIEAEEDERGLKITAEFDDDPMAQKVYRLVKAGRISELSFAFDTIKSAFLEDPDRPNAFRELQELKLYECSVVPIGANSETEVLAIKAAEVGMTAVAEGIKAGRTLSKANESSIRSALEGISAAKDALEMVLPAKADDDDDGEPDAGDDSDTPPPDDDDPTASDTPDDDDDDDDKTKGKGVTSATTQGVSSGTGPSLGESELKELVATAAIEAVEALFKHLGIQAPPSKTSPSPSDPLVAQVQLMELDSPE